MPSQSEIVSSAVRARIAAGTWWNPFGNDLWSAEESALLGTMTDKEVSEKTGRSEHAVRGKRNNDGIPAFVQQDPWTDEEDDLLGTKTDDAVSQEIGRSLQAVRKRRYRLGIDKFKPAWKL